MHTLIAWLKLFSIQRGNPLHNTTCVFLLWIESATTIFDEEKNSRRWRWLGIEDDDYDWRRSGGVSGKFINILISRGCVDIWVGILILLFLLLVWSEDGESCCGNKSILNKGFDRRKLVRHVSQKLSEAELGLHTFAPLVVSFSPLIL